MTAVTSAQRAAPADSQALTLARRDQDPCTRTHSQRAGAAWPRVVPGRDEFAATLDAMAVVHAANWGSVEASWAPLGTIYDPGRLAGEARTALVHIMNASWGERFLPEDRIRKLLRLLDQPDDLLEPLKAMPSTLVEDGFVEVDEFSVPGRSLAVGPAAYDLASFYCSARWWFGRAPLSLAETRNRYLRTLNALLAEPIDRRLFDAAFDAALAWRFALLWPPTIVEHHTCLLACLQHAQAAVIEPAFASLRRSLG